MVVTKLIRKLFIVESFGVFNLKKWHVWMDCQYLCSRQYILNLLPIHSKQSSCKNNDFVIFTVLLRHIPSYLLYLFWILFEGHEILIRGDFQQSVCRLIFHPSGVDTGGPFVRMSFAQSSNRIFSTVALEPSLHHWA